MIDFKDLAAPSLTFKEFKTILGRYDINEKDRDRLSTWFEKSNRSLDAASKIGNIDFTCFMRDGIVHEGGHNTIDFRGKSDFKSINDRFDISTYESEPLVNIKKLLRKALKDILNGYFLNMINAVEASGQMDINNGMNNDIDYIATFTCSENNYYINDITNTGHLTNINRTLKSFCNFDVASSRLRGEMIAGIDINALFYLTKDVSIAGGPAGARGALPPNMISNYLIHAHICFDVYEMQSYWVEGKITDEIVDNIKFLSYVEVSNLTKHVQFPILMHVSDTELQPEQITAINEHNAVFTDLTTGARIIPWGYVNAIPNVHNIESAEIYLPSDCGYKQVIIINNKITEIIKA